MISHWLPWKFFLKRAARAYGIIDPVQFLARMRRFAQPSEVQEPIELLRAGVEFHARGLINTRVIQYNLDWIWPYWVVRQFDPKDVSFIPRAFSFSHVNLTHRSWTAVGRPDMPVYPVIDPRGLVTPFFDSWSIDVWLIASDGTALFPSQEPIATQVLNLSPVLTVKSSFGHPEGMALKTLSWVDDESRIPNLHIAASGKAPEGGWIAISLRPYNPEGIQFIERIDARTHHLRVNSRMDVFMEDAPEKVVLSNYRNGDAARRLNDSSRMNTVTCDVGMATAAALFPFDGTDGGKVMIRIPLNQDNVQSRITAGGKRQAAAGRSGWSEVLAETARLKIPDKKIQFLYDAAVRTLVMLSAADVVPGPYTYRRFWFRDACLMIHALLALGLTDRCGRLLKTFPERQKFSGYFQSQEGEWDSNGQVLWIFDRYQRLTGRSLDAGLMKSLIKGADWIQKKRELSDTGVAHRGLLPAGFSAEHLGPNDHYYWDDFWGLAGLESAERLAGLFYSPGKAAEYRIYADEFRTRIMESIADIPSDRRHGGIPASPYRRMDAGAIGSMVADYPLHLMPEGDAMILSTLEFLIENCFHKGAFYQDMIHSGMNIYLTLAVGQTLLRSNDIRYRNLIRTVADLASPTGQWPEAVHPITGGGCMGDGQHGWAAAEWVMMIRNLFVREEEDLVILGSGIFPEWLKADETVAFGPTPVPGGRVTVSFEKNENGLYVNMNADISKETPPFEIQVPGFQHKRLTGLDDKGNKGVREILSPDGPDRHQAD